MDSRNSYVAIMAGGIGSRFWPESRQNYPKQFHDLLGTGSSLVQWTYERFKKIFPEENIYIITHQQYLPLLKKQLPLLPDSQILSEPSRKNTAAGAAYFTYKIQALNPNANILMAPCDHLILDEDRFKKRCAEAMDFVAQHNDLMLTMGIKPTKPEVCYGYVQYDLRRTVGNLYPVKTFTEKPSAELAKTFIESGDFLWNTGIFAWNAATFIKAMEKYLPEMHEDFSSANTIYNTPAEADIISQIYPRCINVSIDSGMLEKADNVYVLPSAFGWSDLGSWEAVHENTEKDYLGNTVKGKNVIIIDATECVVRAPDDKLVIIQGLEKFIVIDTDNVLLIGSREKEHQIKEYIADIKRNKGDKFL